MVWLAVGEDEGDGVMLSSRTSPPGLPPLRITESSRNIDYHPPIGGAVKIHR